MEREYSRIKWLDIAKGIGMVCVILGHYIVTEEGPLYIIKAVVYSFHMPLFFVIRH